MEDLIERYGSNRGLFRTAWTDAHPLDTFAVAVESAGGVAGLGFAQLLFGVSLATVVWGLLLGAVFGWVLNYLAHLMIRFFGKLKEQDKLIRALVVQARNRWEKDAKKFRKYALEFWPAMERALEVHVGQDGAAGIRLEPSAEKATLPGENHENVEGEVLRGLAADIFPSHGFGAVPENQFNEFHHRRWKMKNLVERMAEHLGDETTFYQVRKTLRKDLWNHQPTLTVLWYLEVALATREGVEERANYTFFQVVKDALKPSTPDNEVHQNQESALGDPER